VILRTYTEDAEDMFAGTRMSMGAHLEELRRRLWRAVVGLGCALFLVFFLDLIGYLTSMPIGIAKPVQDLITQPVVRELQNFYDRRVQQVARDLREGKEAVLAANTAREVELEVKRGELVRHMAASFQLKVPMSSRTGPDEDYVPLRVRIRPLCWALALQQAQAMVGKRPALSTMGVMEAMMVYIKVGIVCGLVLSCPWTFGQLWAFVAAGLYAHEKRPFYAFLPFGIGLFLAGVLVCQFLVMPKAVEALLGFNEWLGYEPDLRLNEWLGFALLMPIVFGLSFQTPLVMLLLYRLGLVRVAAYREKRRLAWFVLAVFCAVACPSADAYSMLLLWVPMCLLYELGVVLCRWSPRPPERTEEEEWEMSQTFEA
jgi:sec-independent protein translocase protein TatC